MAFVREKEKRRIYDISILLYSSTQKQAFRVGREPGQSHVDVSFVAVIVVVGGDIPSDSNRFGSKS